MAVGDDRMNPDDDICRVARRTSVRGVVIEAGDAPTCAGRRWRASSSTRCTSSSGLLDVDGTVLEINQAALDGAGLASRR
jgi:hypothetical protein